MAGSVKLLLVENVEALGIVGDVVSVKVGYARNFLLPRALATQPSDELVAKLAAKRADAQKQVALQRTKREQTTQKLQGVELELIRSCNDQGILYGAITQQDVATALGEKGFEVRARDVRLPGAIKRIDKYDIHMKLDSDLDATIRLFVKPDRELPKDAPEAEKPKHAPAGAEGEKPAAEGEKGERAPRGERPERGERGERGERVERKRVDIFEQALAADKARVVGWGGGEKKAEAASAEGDKKTAKGKGKPAAEKKAKE
ncbi:MAG: 50S ribosomal protein L9 [Phycisphaerales bacterium]|nr:50S ribosomal protein L9 [Phycisphaerales bacterium]